MDIIVKNISKRYGRQKAVDDISFLVKEGEILGFLGPNGAGKTTTMKAISCFMAPDQGDIFVGGISVKEDPDAVKKFIGYLPESNPLYQDMGVIDYLRFVARIHRMEEEQINGQIRKMIRTCGLEGEKHKKIAELSKGYKQRVGLAQALIHDPAVLILDEPTSGLDPNQIVEIRELIRKIGKEKTVILSSHILAEVEATCDRILIINKGKIVADGTAQDLRKRARGREVLRVKVEGGDRNSIFRMLQEIPSIAMVDPLPANEGFFEIQSREDQSSAKNIFTMCVNNSWYLTQLSPVETRLEDVFRELTISHTGVQESQVVE
jgi:ABC-2 type transport system ATP-binding protein